MTRLAIVSKDTCKPQDCAQECEKYCPINRTGKDCIIIPEDGKYALISEILCTGCGICIKKCPFEAIRIINLPEDLDSQITHRYGPNQFKLHRLPVPKKGRIVGLVGQNGAGKSTSLNILAGQFKPNFGNFEGENSWEEVINHYKGNELQNFFKPLSEGKFKVAYKPQNVEKLPHITKGKVKDLILNIDERGAAEKVKVDFSLEKIWDRTLDKLSGGELQRLAIAATFVRKADAYFFDEPSSFLDIKERMKVSNLIRDLVDDETVIIVVEHDLAILDYLSDFVHLYYGEAGAYGVVTYPLSVREGINAFLDGYIPTENMRFRPTPITFQKTQLSNRNDERYNPLISYGYIMKDYGTFKVEADKGDLYQGDIIGILGANGTGKSTFAEMIAGRLEPTESVGEISLLRPRIYFDEEDEIEDEELILEISYKPQYLEELTDSHKTIEQTLMETNPSILASSFFKTELITPLSLEHLMKREIATLSGGELQKAAIAICLAKEADLYVIDEPSAYISAEDRVVVAKSIRRLINHRKATSIVIEHDMMLQAYISDRIIHFDGEPGVYGKATRPLSVQEGMNSFLRSQNITFRADKQTGRPRVNKLNSKLDKEQKVNGNYYQMK